MPRRYVSGGSGRGEIKVVDLKSAYLQIHVCESLWQYQVVRYGG